MAHILIVEDNNEIRENLEEILELCNYQVDAVDNGLSALEMLKSATPDLILCDINMPIMDGYGLLAQVKSNPDFSKIPFIFLTASAQKVDIAKGISAGVSDYLTKPILTEDLEAAIKKHLPD